MSAHATLARLWVERMPERLRKQELDRFLRVPGGFFAETRDAYRFAALLKHFGIVFEHYRHHLPRSLSEDIRQETVYDSR